MRQLDNDMILDLYGATATVEAEDKRLLFAVQRADTVLVANKSFLIEWPIALVDTRADEYEGLLKAARHSDLGRKFTRTPWAKLILIGDPPKPTPPKEFECEEIDPEDDEHFFYRTTGGHVFKYSRHYRSIIDKVWPPHVIEEELHPSVDFKIYVRFGSSPASGLLTMVEGGRKRGMLANAA